MYHSDAIFICYERQPYINLDGIIVYFHETQQCFYALIIRELGKLHAMSEVNSITCMCIFIVGSNNELAEKEYLRTQDNNGTYSMLCSLCTTML